MRYALQTTVAALVVFGLFAQSVGQDSKPRGEKITLKLNLPKGDMKTLVSDMDMNTHVGVANQIIDMKMKMGMDVAFEVQDVDSQGVLTVQMTTKRVHMNMTGGPLSMSYDSDKPAEPGNPVGQMMGVMVNKPITMKLDSAGKSLEVIGVEKLAADLKAGAPPGAAPQVESALAGAKDSMNQTMAHLPDRPVAIGDTWKTQFKMASDPSMPLNFDATYTLKDRRDGVAYVSIDGAVSSAAGLKGTMTGELEIDEKTGWTKKKVIDMKMTGKTGQADVKIDGTTTTTAK